MKKRKMSFTSVGGSSILTIFAVLCFIVFALLSLSTAKADRTLADKTITATENYYKADTRAEEVLAELRSGRMKNMRPVSPTEIMLEMPSGVEILYTRDAGADIFSYSCPIDEYQELQVKIRVKGSDYQIEDWKKVYTGEWTADDSMELFSGVEIDE